MIDELKRGGRKPPAVEFVRLIGLSHSASAKDALYLINSLDDSLVRQFSETCADYSSEVRNVVAQSIVRQIASVDDHENLDQLINYYVEAAPALAPFYLQPKHRFNDQRHADKQIGEWSEVAYREFCETPYSHRREYIRGHALILFVTGPSAPRREAYRDEELLRWIGANAVALGEHYEFLEEHKTWHRDFLEKLMTGEPKPLLGGML